MKAIAKFAVNRHWWVIAAWLAAILGSQLLAAAAGGASYKDVFTLPGTETQQVLNLLRHNGQAGRTGQVGTVVVHARTGTLNPRTPPDHLMPTLEGLCTAGVHVASITSAWGSYLCGPKGAVPAPAAIGAQPTRNRLLSNDDKVGLVTIAWQGNENALANFIGVHDRLASLSSRKLELEFTGPAFANLAAQQQGGIPPELFGFIAALLILAIVFRSVGATVAAAAQRRGGARRGPRPCRPAQPRR